MVRSSRSGNPPAWVRGGGLAILLTVISRREQRGCIALIAVARCAYSRSQCLPTKVPTLILRLPPCNGLGTTCQRYQDRERGRSKYTAYRPLWPASPSESMLLEIPTPQPFWPLAETCSFALPMKRRQSDRLLSTSVLKWGAGPVMTCRPLSSPFASACTSRFAFASLAL